MHLHACMCVTNLNVDLYHLNYWAKSFMFLMCIPCQKSFSNTSKPKFMTLIFRLLLRINK